MRLTTITPPAEPAVSLAEAKLHCRVDNTIEDALIASFVATATARVELEIDRALVTQTLEWSIAAGYWYGDWGRSTLLLLPRPPLIAVEAVDYIDPDGITVTYDGYRVLPGTVGAIAPPYGTPWPRTTSLAEYAVNIRFTAGYGDPADVPEAARVAILCYTAFMYQHRGDADMPPPAFVARILDPLRWH